MFFPFSSSSSRNNYRYLSDTFFFCANLVILVLMINFLENSSNSNFRRERPLVLQNFQLFHWIYIQMIHVFMQITHVSIVEKPNIVEWHIALLFLITEPNGIDEMNIINILIKFLRILNGPMESVISFEPTCKFIWTGKKLCFTHTSHSDNFNWYRYMRTLCWLRVLCKHKMFTYNQFHYHLNWIIDANRQPSLRQSKQLFNCLCWKESSRTLRQIYTHFSVLLK